MRRPIVLGVIFGVIGVAVAGCILTSEVDVVGCKSFICRVTPHPVIMAKDDSALTVPLTCRDEAWRPSSPKGQHEWLTAIAYTPSDGQWRRASFDREQFEVDNKPIEHVTPALVHEIEERHSCAADCSKFVYLRQINPPGHGYHYEVIYGENGVERQLTHSDPKLRGMSWPGLSADGRTAVVRVGQAIALIDVASGETHVVPFGEAAWKECTGSR